jgi:integrase/recombinase XerD
VAGVGIEDYLQYLEEKKNIRPATRQGYRKDLEQLLLWAGRKGVRTIRELDRTLLQTYVGDLEREGLAPRTIRRKMTTVRGYFSFLRDRGVLLKNHALDLALPEEEEGTARVLSLEEISAILSAPDCSDWMGLRDKALLELLYGSGMKVSEIISLKVKNVDLQVSCVIMEGRRQEERMIPFGDRARKALLRYLSIMRGRFSGPEQILFINREGDALSRQSIWKMVRQYAKTAGVRGSVSPELLRTSLAVHLLEYGADLESVKDILGHSTKAATRRYGHRASRAGGTSHDQ